MALKQLRFNLDRRNAELFGNGDQSKVEKGTHSSQNVDKIELENKLIDYLTDPFIELPLNSIQLPLKFNLNNRTRLSVSLLNDLLVKFANVYRLIKYSSSICLDIL